mmetsp:Transcript_922/g.2658  ORF Transcript_922/g.2658 Transcript_922/m.2658 type:complete len:88 (-) Transcript_922:558-821(-)
MLEYLISMSALMPGPRLHHLMDIAQEVSMDILSQFQVTGSVLRSELQGMMTMESAVVRWKYWKRLRMGYHGCSGFSSLVNLQTDRPG